MLLRKDVEVANKNGKSLYLEKVRLLVDRDALY